MFVYLNNFKGFSDTIIPILGVIFLVGDNSTGKSTVLSAIELLSKTSFWIDHQFNTSECRLGPFREIVNSILKKGLHSKLAPILIQGRSHCQAK